MQILIGVWEARHEFVDGHYISAIGHVLMAMVRGGQMGGQVKMLQTKWEVDEIVKKLSAKDISDVEFDYYVGKLAEKWQFPSDHLPVGAKVGNAHVISWNVLNNYFMEWVTTLDSQGLNGSLISKLNDRKSATYPGLTQRDELIMAMLLKMMGIPITVAISSWLFKSAVQNLCARWDKCFLLRWEWFYLKSL